MLYGFIVFVFFSLDPTHSSDSIPKPQNEDQDKHPVAVKQKFDDKDININLHKLEKSQDHSAFKSCADPKNNLVYIHTSKTVSDKAFDHSLYVMDLSTEQMTLIRHEQTEFHIYGEKIFCFGGLLIVTSAENKGVWSRIHSEQTLIFHNITYISDVLINEHNSNMVALSSTDKKLHILNAKTRERSTVSQVASKPKWSANGLYFIESQSVIKKLIFHSTDTNHNREIYDHVQDYGYDHDVLWAFIRTPDLVKITFKVGKRDYDGEFGDTNIDMVMDVKIRDKIIVVTLKEIRKVDWTVWLAEPPNFEFSLISDHLLVEDTEYSAFTFYTAAIEYYVGMIDQLSGIIFVSKITRKHYGKSTKSTYISYNHGNTFIPLHPANESRMCDWPTCQIYIPPTKRSLFDSFKFAKNYPLLMAGQCTYIQNGVEIPPRYMISNDGGYSWENTSVEFKDMIILNEGEVMIGSNKALYFSVDLGSKWTELNFQQGGVNTKYLMKGQDAAKYKVATILQIEKQKDVYLAVVDFEQVFQKKCEDYDFHRYTPGYDLTKACFHGVRGTTYLKYPDKICRSDFKNLPKIESEICDCTPEDYRCPFEYIFHQGKCYTRNINTKNKHVHECDDLSDLVPSLITPTKFIDNKCREDPVKLELMEICGYTQNHFTVSMIVTKKLMFVDLMDSKKIPTLFSDELQFDKTILNFKIDKFKNCIYMHTEEGIYRKCYRTAMDFHHRPILISQDVRIVGMDLDSSNHYIYYHTKHSILVIDLKMMLISTIYTTSDIIYFLKLDKKQLKIYISCMETSTKDIVVHVLSMAGSAETSFKFKTFVTEIEYSRDKFTIYTEKGVFIYVMRNKSSIYVQEPIKHLKYLHTVSQNEFITNHGFSFETSFVLYKNIREANLEVDIYSSLPKSCRFSNCDYFCFPLTGDRFVCGCPDPLIFNQRTRKCECLHPLGMCNVCQKDEFLCHNQKCILFKYYCDGVDDCGDNSDEKFCTKTCGRDEFVCMKQKEEFCLKLDHLCNGVPECDDGVDEAKCDHRIKKCKEGEFECLDERCIPNNRVCDGENDCGDWSDEKNCLERYCEKSGGFCDDGTCIPDKYICDGVFHCMDFSDERACNPRTIFENNMECLIKCDARCVPIHQICDHITDCSDHSDEILCGFEPMCSKSQNRICDDYQGCFEEKQVCDGFNDCHDGSDEICKNFPKCFGGEEFTCKNGHIICMSRVCDGVNDCFDAEDEQQFCQNNNHIHDINIEIQGMGKVLFSWNHNGVASEFQIYIQTMGNNNVIEKIVHGTKIIIDGHSDCGRYLVVVKDKRRVLKYKQYKYMQGGVTLKPFDLEYNHHDGMLRWKIKSLPCMGLAFYIECFSGKILSFRNFSRETFIKISSRVELVCHVASCPKMVLNISCSPFSNDILIKHVVAVTSQTIIVVISVVIVILVFVIVAFVVYKKFFKHKQLHTSFKTLSLKNIISDTKNQNVNKDNV